MGTRPALATLLLLAAAGAGCPSRELPPPPTRDEEPKKEDAPFCGKVFKDAKVRGGAQCCLQPSAGLLKSADIVAACGAAATAYLGETKDGAACRLHFQVAGGDAAADVRDGQPSRDPERRAGADGPDPLLPMTWKKITLRDALGFQAVGATNPALLEKQTVLWAGRGRRIVGLHVSKQLCTPAQAEALLQKVIDAVP